MTRLQFEEYINNPVLLGEANLPELKLITEAFPWFQSAFLLYVKALSNSGHTDYYDYLKKTSILVPDRKALYQLINKKTQGADETNTEQKAGQFVSTENFSTPSSSDEQSNQNYSVVQEIAFTSNQSAPHSSPEIIIEKVEQTEVPEVKHSSLKKIELIITPRENPSEKTKESVGNDSASSVEKEPATEAPPVLSDLNEVIINPVVNAYIEKEILHVTEINKPISESRPESENQFLEKEKQILKETLNEPHSFSEWLKLVSRKKEIPAADLNNEKTSDEIPPEKNNEDRTRKQAIIDHLIRHEPGHIRIKESVEFFTPAKHARESNKADETLVTETLAWIYEQQGNYGKAIRAYQILSLKFPEKSVYFAGLIQKIKIKQKEK